MANQPHFSMHEKEHPKFSVILQLIKIGFFQKNPELFIYFSNIKFWKSVKSKILQAWNKVLKTEGENKCEIRNPTAGIRNQVKSRENAAAYGLKNHFVQRDSKSTTKFTLTHILVPQCVSLIFALKTNYITIVKRFLE